MLSGEIALKIIIIIIHIYVYGAFVMNYMNVANMELSALNLAIECVNPTLWLVITEPIAISHHLNCTRNMPQQVP